jgi:hypothetical protein
MRIKGKLHRITNPTSFAASFLKTDGKPTAGFAPMGKTRVHLAIDFPSGKFSGGFIPPMSLKTDANGQGEFSFTVPDSAKDFRGRLIAFRTTMMPPPVPGMPSIPILDPIYRSAPFKFKDVSAQEQSTAQKIFIHTATTPPDRGISQQEVDAQVSALRKEMKLDKLRATLLSGKVSATAELKGGVVKFAAFVRGSTSEDLGRVIEVKAGEIDIDLPGPDFIVGLCVDEEDIEKRIRKGLAGLSKKISGELLAALEQEAPGIGSLATVSVWRTRFVQTGTKSIKVPGAPAVQAPVFTVVPDAAFGVPKKLY